MATDISADAAMAEIRGRVRERLREQLLAQGVSAALQDPALFAEVERILTNATTTADLNALILPELLGAPDSWRLETALHYRSHRGTGAAATLMFVKRRLLMPMFRWLFEYSRDNFERQRRVNQVLFACVQELAVENARLRRDLTRLTGDTAVPERPEGRTGR